MDIIEITIAEIKPAAYNPRKDLKPGEAQYEKLKKIIGKYDLVELLVWNRRTGNLVGGHQRLKILVERGDERVQVVAVDLEPKDEKALSVALNKVQGDWDFPKLADLLQELDDGSFDLSFTGFDEAELEKLATWTPEDENGDARSNNPGGEYG